MHCVICCAEDPLWWNETEVALLKGTRLEIAVTEHQKILQKLAYWRDHLVDLEGYCGVLSREPLFRRGWFLEHSNVSKLVTVLSVTMLELVVTMLPAEYHCCAHFDTAILYGTE